MCVTLISLTCYETRYTCLAAHALSHFQPEEYARYANITIKTADAVWCLNLFLEIYAVAAMCCAIVIIVRYMHGQVSVRIMMGHAAMGLLFSITGIMDGISSVVRNE